MNWEKKACLNSNPLFFFSTSVIFNKIFIFYNLHLCAYQPMKEGLSANGKKTFGSFNSTFIKPLRAALVLWAYKSDCRGSIFRSVPICLWRQLKSNVKVQKNQLIITILKTLQKGQSCCSTVIDESVHGRQERKKKKCIVFVVICWSIHF